MKCYYPTDKSGNRIGFKTPEACIFDTSGKNLTNKLNQLRSDVNGKAAANHGTHVPAPQAANNKIYLRNDNTWHTITPGDIGAAASSHSHSWDSITGKPSLYTTSQIDSKISAINSNISTLKNNFFIIQEYTINAKNIGLNEDYSTYVDYTTPSGYTLSWWSLGQGWDGGFTVIVVPPSLLKENRFVIGAHHNYITNGNTELWCKFRIVFTKTDMTSITSK